MAFCKYCGTQLQDGQLCGCEKAVAARTVVETPVAPVQQAAPQQQPVYQQPVYQQPAPQPVAPVIPQDSADDLPF